MGLLYLNSFGLFQRKSASMTDLTLSFDAAIQQHSLKLYGSWKDVTSNPSTFVPSSESDLLSADKQPCCNHCASNTEQQALFSAHAAYFAAHGIKIR
jgi:hypothetical protein